MKDLKAYMESGILELYVLDALTDAERLEVQDKVANHPEIAAEVEALESALLGQVVTEAIAPPAAIEDALEKEWTRLETEEKEKMKEIPRILSHTSSIEDYKPWLDDPNIKPPSEYENVFFIPIHESERGMTVVVWMKEGSPEEVHHEYIEKFLIVEGTCEIRVVDTVHTLNPGDYISIPLHLHHEVKVTSDIPCKIVLQRLAA